MNKRRNRHYEDILDQGKDLIKFYMENPCIAAYDLLGVDLAPIQRVVFNDMWFKDYVIVVAGRGYGKSYLLGLLATLSSMLKPGYRTGLMSPSFRQCLVLDDSCSTFWTDKGLITGSKVLYDSVRCGETKIQSLVSNNIILNKWVNDEHPCIKITTNKGYELSGAYHHRILTLDHDLNLEYKELKDLNEKDLLAVKKGFNRFGNNDIIDICNIESELSRYMGSITLPRVLNKDLSYFLGLICGDGFIEGDFTKKRLWTVGYCSEDEELINKYKGILYKEFNIDSFRINESKHGNTFRVEVNSIVLWHYIKSLGMSNSGASDKDIPHVIKKSSRENILSFLSGVFDTDGSCSVYSTGKNKALEVNFVSTSNKLCREIQSVLLNIGIVSSFSVKSKKLEKYFKNTKKIHECQECYRLRINGTNNLTGFNSYVGFKLNRKSSILENYICNISKEDFNDTIPNTFNFVYNLAMLCSKERGSDLEFLKFYINKYKKYRKTNFTSYRIKELLKYAKSLLINSSEYNKLESLLDLNLGFLSVLKKEEFKAKTIDIEVENESCYWANGFINHNSKMIFSEVEKLYAQSSIFREACEKPPVRGTDSCYVKFRSVAGVAPSFIEAVPLGNDGGKIRGSRFYLIVVDELAQVPDSILDLVIRPFGATSLAPMERVRRMEQQEKLIKLGLATDGDFEKETVNKMIMTSSGYYKFNHMWRRMKDHWQQIDEAAINNKESPYAVWQIPYWDLPTGFLDMNNINEAKRVMSMAEFRMEYEAAMISDSEGFFKASLINSCATDTGHTVSSSGEAQHQYVLGVDPNQGGKASTGISVIKLGPVNRIVNVLELKKHTTQQITSVIQELCESYNVSRIFMDRGGGGKAICDLLEEGYGGFEPIIDRTNEEHKQLQGRHILELVNFNPAWIADANFTTKAMLEGKRLLFPEAPIDSTSDSSGVIFENVGTLKSQMLNIIVSQTATGILHFDTPVKGQNKDLYSSLILAAHGANILEKELEEDTGPILHNNGGMIRLRNGASDFSPIVNDKTQGFSNKFFAAALLKKKVK